MGVNHKAELGQVLKNLQFWDHSNSPVSAENLHFHAGPLAAYDTCLIDLWIEGAFRPEPRINEHTKANSSGKNSLFMCHWALKPGSTGSTSSHSVCKKED